MAMDGRYAGNAGAIFGNRAFAVGLKRVLHGRDTTLSAGRWHVRKDVDRSGVDARRGTADDAVGGAALQSGCARVRSVLSAAAPPGRADRCAARMAGTARVHA